MRTLLQSLIRASMLICASLATTAYATPIAGVSAQQESIPPSIAWAAQSVDAPAEWAVRVAAQKQRRTALTRSKTLELRAVVPSAKELEPDCFEDIACIIVLGLAEEGPKASSSADFRKDLEAATALSRILLVGADTAAGPLDKKAPDTPDKILVRLGVRGQILRNVLLLVDYEPRATTENVRAYLKIALRAEIRRGDAEATTFVKERLAQTGWPLSDDPQARRAAWLIVQHSDNDPAFQALALKRLAGQLGDGTVNPHDFAYLYDRVHLRAEGRQRYGTQMVCKAGAMEPAPLDDTSLLETRRKEMGLSPMSEYRLKFERSC